MLNMTVANSSSIGAITLVGSQSDAGYKLWTLAYIALFYFQAVVIAVILWYKLWVKNLGGKDTKCSKLTAAFVYSGGPNRENGAWLGPQETLLHNPESLDPTRVLPDNAL